MTGPDAPTEPTPEEFEEMVAALLKVDPEGIAGQRAKPKADDEPR